ncbi:unnamed protein product [Diplocarpon coronariae]|nr:hypothetical protein JHW43_006148 [Diplocarpon mali]
MESDPPPPPQSALDERKQDAGERQGDEEELGSETGDSKEEKEGKGEEDPGRHLNRERTMREDVLKVKPRAEGLLPAAVIEFRRIAQEPGHDAHLTIQKALIAIEAALALSLGPSRDIVGDSIKLRSVAEAQVNAMSAQASMIEKQKEEVASVCPRLAGVQDELTAVKENAEMVAENKSKNEGREKLRSDCEAKVKQLQEEVKELRDQLNEYEDGAFITEDDCAALSAEKERFHAFEIEDLCADVAKAIRERDALQRILDDAATTLPTDIITKQEYRAMNRELSDKLQEAEAQVGEAKKHVADFHDLLDRMPELEAANESLEHELEFANKKYEDMMKRLNDLVEPNEELGHILEDENKKVAELQQRNVGGADGAAKKSIMELKDSNQALTQDLLKAQTQSDAYVEQIRELRQNISDGTDETARNIILQLQGEIEKLRQDLVDANAHVKALEQALLKGAGKVANEEIARRGRQLDELTDIVRGMTEERTELYEEIDDLKNQIIIDNNNADFDRGESAAEIRDLKARITGLSEGKTDEGLILLEDCEAHNVDTNQRLQEEIYRLKREGNSNEDGAENQLLRDNIAKLQNQVEKLQGKILALQAGLTQGFLTVEECKQKNAEELEQMIERVSVEREVKKGMEEQIGGLKMQIRDLRQKLKDVEERSWAQAKIEELVQVIEEQNESIKKYGAGTSAERINAAVLEAQENYKIEFDRRVKEARERNLSKVRTEGGRAAEKRKREQKNKEVRREECAAKKAEQRKEEDDPAAAAVAHAEGKKAKAKILRAKGEEKKNNKRADPQKITEAKKMWEADKRNLQQLIDAGAKDDDAPTPYKEYLAHREQINMESKKSTREGRQNREIKALALQWQRANCSIWLVDIALSRMKANRALNGLDHGDADAAIDRANEAIGLADATGNAGLMARSRLWATIAYFYANELTRAEEFLQQVKREYLGVKDTIVYDKWNKGGPCSFALEQRMEGYYKGTKLGKRYEEQI